MKDSSPGPSPSPGRFSPVLARTQTAVTAIAPIAFDCVKFIIIRGGSARLFSELGSQHVNVGDVVVLAANTLCGAEPEGWVTTTTLYLDRDYVIDQVFWQYAARFKDRLDASTFLDTNYAEPAQVVRIGDDRAGLLMPWLDELTALSVEGLPAVRFYRAQALVSAVLDVIVPHLAVTDERISSTQRSTVVPSAPRHRAFRPLRDEARHVAELLSGELDRRWSVPELAGAVHLSPSQLRRVFTASFGKSPIAYLTMLRAERMAHLLKVTDSPISVIAVSVGWGDPDFAAQQFRRSIGVAPSEYRRISRKNPLPSHPE
ncbi:helix-turn-helix transcriptional regulator [Gulosibacter chungangensis]|uniref:Helix-turn-helix transcriptional regulator n=1 Tax=Gulosibacter chungangensis TaxID=979746 RepID=A0A7J5BAH7_9MICO|nr:AraC family transcriptional regulator [Gulosibacter chungangensis]KAB1643055.1 helix-turn-helix transcriptional regulator [Gulosibacter chungangensis]